MTEAIKYHEEVAEKFRGKYLNTKSFKSRLKEWENLIRELKTPITQSMDLGSGPGWMTKILCDVSKNVVAIDGSDQMIIQSRKTLGNSGDRVEFLNASIAPQLFDKWTEGSFDLVISSSVLEYVNDLDQVLAKVYKVLAPSGTLIFSIPNKQSAFRWIEHIMFKWFGRPKYRGLLVNVWSKDHVTMVLQRVGFKIEKIQFQGYVPIFSELLFWMPVRFEKPMMIIVAKK